MYIVITVAHSNLARDMCVTVGYIVCISAHFALYINKCIMSGVNSVCSKTSNYRAGNVLICIM